MRRRTPPGDIIGKRDAVHWEPNRSLSTRHEPGRIYLSQVLFLFFIVATMAAGGNLQETSIFGVQTSCKGTKGSLKVEDLTVLGFTIGSSTIRDVVKRFPNTKQQKLGQGDGAETGICVKNGDGQAVVFATGVMGAPDTLTSIYMAAAARVESARVTCALTKLRSKAFSSKSGIRIGTTAAEVSKIVGANLSSEGAFCTAYEIGSDQGPLQISKGRESDGFTDFTGVEGSFSANRMQWVRIFGNASN